MMQTNALELAEQSAISGQSERLTWGVIELQVTDLDRSVDFWTQALGLIVHNKDRHRAVLGTAIQTLFVLHAGATVPVSRRHLGMFHIALGMPDQAEFSRLLARLISLGIRVSLTDHLMSKAIYFADPDGLEIEIALETPGRFGRFGDMSKGLVLYDIDGHSHSGRAYLDVKSELQHADGKDLKEPLSNEAFTAHLHLKVAQLEPAAAWFESIGFARNLMLPDMGFADMGAGADYTHRIAMNTWAGPNLQPAPRHMARLTRYALHIHDPTVMANIQALQSGQSSLKSSDPTGTDILLIPTFS